AAACTLANPLDYLSNGGSPDDAGPDGAGDGSGGTPIDAGGGSDALADAAGAGPGGLSVQPTPFLCADFGEGELTKVYQSGAPRIIPAPVVCAGCAASIGSVARSSPGAFTSFVPANAASSGSLLVRYEQPVTYAAKGQSIRLDLRMLEMHVGHE